MHAISPHGRHLFWTVPGRGPFRVVNPGLGMRYLVLGQESAAQPSVINRLDLLPIRIIKDRGILILAAGADGKLPDDPAAVRQGLADAVGSQRLFVKRDERLDVDISAWADEDLRTLIQVANGPTPDEIADLGTIDALFGVPADRLPWAQQRPGMLEQLRMTACGEGRMEGTPQAVRQFERLERGIPWLKAQQQQRRGGRAPTAAPLSGNPFFCTQPSQLPVDATFFHLNALGGVAEYFKIDVDEEWGEVKGVVQNLVVLLGQLNGYPFPSPISAMPGVFYQYAQKDLAGVIRYEGAMTPEVARFIVTLVVLQHYEGASARIIHLLKKKAKKQKRKAIIKAVALTAVSIVFAFAAPAAIAAGFGAVQTAIDVKQARDAAKDMAKAAKQFAQTDAAFSAEVEKAAGIMDTYAAQQELAAEPTPEEAEALAEEPEEVTPETVGVQNAPPYEEEAPLGDLLVGGGIAAAAVGLLALLR